ncbi:DDE-type integrase/transposase/recombinase [Streptomyces microflavus]|uniref:DDE-type integrase/transposase/recombinase n=1 Tax=Streptomyces microflavus TaxID=1919 RepID=UPI003802F468
MPDLLRRNFTAPAPDRAWIGDITYLPLAGGSFLYLATVIDVFSRRLLGWSMAGHMRAELVTDALNAAIRTRGGPVDGVIFHNDHGAQGEGVRRRLRPGRGPPVHGSGRHLRGVVLRLTQTGDSARPTRLADSKSRPARRLPLARAFTTTGAGTPRSATSHRSPSNRDQIRWPSLHDNRCPRSRWKPRPRCHPIVSSPVVVERRR